MTSYLTRLSRDALFAQLTFYFFFTAIFFTGFVKQLTALFIILAFLSAVLASPTHTVFLKGKHTFSKLYYYVFVAFMILVSLNILFGRADWEGYVLLITFPLAFLIALTLSNLATKKNPSIYI